MNISLKWIIALLVIMLPIITFNTGYILVSYESYRFSFLALLLLLISVNISIDRTLFGIYLFIFFSVIFSAVYNYYDIYTNGLLEQSVIVHTIKHIISQAFLYLLFVSLVVAIVSTKIKSFIFVFAFKAYIIFLAFVSILSISLLMLEMVGIELIGSSYSFGMYKLQGILGEPKQFSAAMLSGILLLNMSTVNRVNFFSKHARVFLSVLFVLSGLASFSSSFFGSLVLVILLYGVLKLFSMKQIIVVILLTGLIILQSINSRDCGSSEQFYERSSIGDGVNVVFNKISSFGSIVSFLPKDGAVIVDSLCRPEHYILGGGPGSLYKEFTTTKLSNYDSLVNISIFEYMRDVPLSSTQAASTFQVRLFSDYGIIGVVLLLALLIRSENILLGFSKKNSDSMYFFFVFIMSIQYFMFLILMYLFALKVIHANQYGKI